MKSPAVVNFSREPHSVEIREFARPEPGPDDVILAVEAVGVCHRPGTGETVGAVHGVLRCVARRSGRHTPNTRTVRFRLRRCA